MPVTLNRETFAAHLNERFCAVIEPGNEVELKLVEVAALASGSKGDESQRSLRQDPFTLVFSGPRDMPLEQGTFHVEHDQIGRFDLFLVPIGEDQSNRQYEAVFN